MNPPLRETRDRDEMIRGIVDGSVDVLATDHAPHHADEKGVEFDRAPFGIVGLETAVSLTFDRLVHPGLISLRRFVELLVGEPGARARRRRRLAAPRASPPTSRILAPDLAVTIDPARFVSKARNTPFGGWTLQRRRRRHHRRRPRRLHQPGGGAACSHCRLPHLSERFTIHQPSLQPVARSLLRMPTDRHFVTRERARKDMESLGRADDRRPFRLRQRLSRPRLSEPAPALSLIRRRSGASRRICSTSCRARSRSRPRSSPGPRPAARCWRTRSPGCSMAAAA